MKIDAPLEHPSHGELGAARYASPEKKAGTGNVAPPTDVVSQIQANSLKRLAEGGTLKEDIVNVLVVSTVISPPFG